MAKLIRTGKASCGLQGSGEGGGGICWPFAQSLERRVTAVEMKIVGVSQKQDPIARLLILCLDKVLVHDVLLRCPL